MCVRIITTNIVIFEYISFLSNILKSKKVNKMNTMLRANKLNNINIYSMMRIYGNYMKDVASRQGKKQYTGYQSGATSHRLSRM